MLNKMTGRAEGSEPQQFLNAVLIVVFPNFMAVHAIFGTDATANLADVPGLGVTRSSQLVPTGALEVVRQAHTPKRAWDHLASKLGCFHSSPFVFSHKSFCCEG